MSYEDAEEAVDAVWEFLREENSKIHEARMAKIAKILEESVSEVPPIEEP